MQLFTDSSLVGFGGIFQNQWFCSEWPPQLPSIKDGDLSMAFRELYPIVAAAIIWGKSWTSKRIRFLSDNLSTVFIIQHGVRSMFANHETYENANVDCGKK